jgi:lipopolysaccharide export system permease protein
LIAIVVGALGIWLNPKFNLERNRVLESASANMAFHTIVPERFQSSRDATKVFYTEKLSANKKILKNFFVADQIDHVSQPTVQEWNIISARQAYNMHDEATGDDFIVAADGYRYRGVIGNLDFQIIKFAEYGMRINKLAKERARGSEQNISIGQLLKLKSQQKKYMAELQWRLSLPLMALVLPVLAVALSRVNPRQGRFTRFVPAILLYIIYANMLFVNRDWVESDKISVWLGMWWTHAAVLLLALYLMLRRR